MYNSLDGTQINMRIRIRIKKTDDGLSGNNLFRHFEKLQNLETKPLFTYKKSEFPFL